MSDKSRWKEVSLDALCEIATGKYDANHATPNGKYRFYTCAYEFMYCNTNRFNGECIILPGNGANVGEVFYYSGEFDAYQRTYVLENIKISSKFLYYHLKSSWKRLNSDKQFGSATNYIRMGNFTSYLVEIPPLAEQYRIVAKIEELFSELDKGVETLKTAQEQLKVYRQAVLKYFFSYYSFDTTLGELYEFIGGGTPSKENSNYWNGDIPWASVKDIKSSYLLSTQDSISQSGLENSATNIADIDHVILITRINPGKTIISKIRTAINQDLKVVKPREKSLPLYVHYLFQFLEKECVRLSSGTTVLGITLSNLKEIAAPQLDFNSQKNIVTNIESRLSVCDKIEESIQQGLQQAEALRQSILKKAFEGKLVPQDPNDEPASVLLERIKTERASAQPVKTPNTKKTKK